jgi:hypothetical protein
VIEGIFDEEVNRIINNFDDDEDFVFKTFILYQETYITKLELIKMIVSLNQDLK